jgi:hypothetical protein
MVSKADRMSTVVLFSKKSQKLQLVDFSWILPHRLQWQNSDKMSSKSSKCSVKVNSRLRGRFEILQQLTFLEKVDHTVDFSKKIQRLSTSQTKNPATVDLSSKVDCRLQCLVAVISYRDINVFTYVNTPYIRNFSCFIYYFVLYFLIYLSSQVRSDDGEDARVEERLLSMGRLFDCCFESSWRMFV